MLCRDAARVWSASPAIMSDWSVKFVYQVDVGAVRNIICVPSQDIKVAIDWFSAVMWGAIRMCNSPIAGASKLSGGIC